VGVIDRTKGDQVPWFEDGIQRRKRPVFARAADADRPAYAPSAVTSSEVAQAWAAIKDTTNSAVIEIFLRRYGEGFYADLARARLEELKKARNEKPASAAPEQSAPVAATPLGRIGDIDNAAPSNPTARPARPSPEQSAPAGATPLRRIGDIDNTTSGSPPRVSVVAPTTAPAPPPQQVATAPPKNQSIIDPDEAARLIARGESLLDQGDVAAARVVLERAVMGGDPRAALELGSTYDATFLSQRKLVGATPDATRARFWYERARRYGSPEAEQRLAALGAPPVAPCGAGTPTTVSLSTRSPRPLSANEECALKPKDVFKECDKCPEMVVVPAGSFTMGAAANDAEGLAEEGPQHPVTFSQPFAVGEFSVTFDEWDACVADGCTNYKPSDQGWGRGRRPVINVTWGDAQAYAMWLSRKTGKRYRLLSESEREYVTRARTATPFWWGASISTSQANYDGNYTFGSGAKGEYRQKTMPVESFQPNPWGLYQVHGNVWEWVEDCYHDTYDGAPSDGSAWTGGDCKDRVLRGGSWSLNPRYLRAAGRGRLTTNRVGAYGDGIGFRVGRTLTP
jgi:formylglycine-generating enzyme required for sulfatase activity